MSIKKCIPCKYAVIQKNYDRITKSVIACRKCQDIFAPECEYRYINTEAKGKQTMAKLTIPIIIDWDSIKDRMAEGNIVKVVRCEECMHNGSFDTDCPIDWNGKEYCNFGERRVDDD